MEPMATASASGRITARPEQAISGSAPPIRRPIVRRAAYSSLTASPEAEAAIIASATSPALARIACSTASLTSP